MDFMYRSKGSPVDGTAGADAMAIMEETGMKNQMEAKACQGVVRVTHRSSRFPGSQSSTKRQAYFKRLQDEYDRIYCWHQSLDCNPYQSELDFYDMHYRPWIEKRNRVYAVERHWERITSASKLHEKTRTCPEELVIQLTADDGEILPDISVFLGCMMGYVTWMREWGRENGDCLHVLGVYVSRNTRNKAIIRWVWDCNDGSGLRKVCQTGALIQAGVLCPDGSAEASRYSNPKMTFDQESREVLYGLLEAAGIPVNRKPRIYTSRKARALRDSAKAAERDAAAVLKEILDVEAMAPMLDPDGNVPGAVPEGDGIVLVPEGSWRILIIRQSLEGAFAYRMRASRDCLCEDMATRRKAVAKLAAQRAELDAAEVDDTSQRLGLMRLGYTTFEECGPGDKEDIDRY